MADQALTIGELAKRTNVSTSLLRYYEKENLLQPSGRTPSGYRLYAPHAERTLRFIRNAQRYGFSLNDIRLILGAGTDAKSDAADIRDIAEQRFLEIERRVTEMLVMRHELELFLDDVADHIDRTAGASVSRQYRDLLEQVCGHDTHRHGPSSLQKLVERLGCKLASAEWEQLLADLHGQHFHIWQEEDGYSILFTSPDARVQAALQRLAESESDCDAHVEPEVTSADGGCLFRANGSNSFLFAQLFLALEASEP